MRLLPKAFHAHNEIKLFQFFCRLL